MKIEEIRERRRREISEGRNLGTASPLYIVYEQIFTVCENDTRYDQSTTVFGDGEEYVRHDHNGGERLAESDVEKWGDCEGEWSEVVKKSFHDRFVTVCFTREGAEEFIKAEGHNLTNPRIYVGHVGRRNVELRGVLGLLGDD